MVDDGGGGEGCAVRGLRPVWRNLCETECGTGLHCNWVWSKGRLCRHTHTHSTMDEQPVHSSQWLATDSGQARMGVVHWRIQFRTSCLSAKALQPNHAEITTPVAAPTQLPSHPSTHPPNPSVGGTDSVPNDLTLTRKTAGSFESVPAPMASAMGRKRWMWHARAMRRSTHPSSTCG